MKISNNIFYIGVNDHKIDLFEGQYIVPEGMAYNSYLIKDEKIAVIDSVDANFSSEWLNNIEEVLGENKPDYLIVQHVEPDHSGSVISFTNKYPNATVVASLKAFTFLKQFFGSDFNENRIIVADGSKLELGNHTLNFVTAPMVHWPEVIMTYEENEKVLFSADAFGKFGALDCENDDWACEARRYYFGIVGKYGAQVQALIKKLSSFDVSTICPLHGPVLNENLGYYLNLYDIWSSYGVESEGVLICYTSIYGNTKKAVELLADTLKENGCSKVVVNDLARCDMAEAVEDAFRYGKIVLATTTYNGEIFPFMKTFIDALVERSFKNKTVAIIENGTWAPMAKKTILKLLEGSKNITYTQNNVTINSSLSENNIDEIKLLAKELI